MHSLVQILGCIYIYIVFPVLAGYVFVHFFKLDKKTFQKYYVYGYGLNFFWFYIFVEWQIFRQNSLEEVLIKYRYGLYGLTIIFIALFIFYIWKENKVFKIQKLHRDVVAVGALVIAAIGMSLVTIPHLQDETTELVNVMLKTDTIYGFNAYSNVEYQWVPRKYKFSPIELWYVLNARLCDIDGSIMVKYVVPVAMLLLAFCVYKLISDWIWKDNTKKSFYFLFIILVLEIGVVFSKNTMIGLCLLQNSWNGQTILFSIWIPLIIYMGLSFSERKKSWINLILIVGGIFIAQLFYCNGWVLGIGTGFICAIAEVICLIRRKVFDKHH